MKTKHLVIACCISIVFAVALDIMMHSGTHDCMKDPEVMAKLHADSIAYHRKDSMYLQSNGFVLRVKQDPLWEYYQENAGGER